MEISNDAVWQVCDQVVRALGDGKPCYRCPRQVDTQYGEGQQMCRSLAEDAIETVLRAVAEHPAGLPEGWVKGP